jgi:CHAT domain-containing protein/Flp pilus assembly protein TadD
MNSESLAPPSLKTGIVVDWLTKNSQAEKAGIQPGDILISWSRGDAKGAFVSPFDLPYIRFEQASRGMVRIDGLRGAKKQSWLLGSDTWGIAGRPNLREPLSTIYQEGQQLAQVRKGKEAADRWRAAATLPETSSVSWLSSWFLMRVAQVLFSAQEWDASDHAYGEAIERARANDPVVRAELFRQRGSGFDYRDDVVNAEKYYLQALLEWRKLGTDTMAVATSLNQVGSVALLQGDLSGAERYFRQALSISHALARNSMQLAWSLSSLGTLHQSRGDLEQAEKLYLLALAHEERYFPDSRILVETIRNLGIVAQQRGDLARAEAHFRRALAKAEKLDVSNLDDVAAIVGYLAECVLDQGYPENAEEYERRALAIREKMSPDSLAVALSFRNLGKIARIRGDLAAADNYYQQALTIGERLAPSSLETARFLIGLGYVARDRGDFATSEQYYKRALAIMEKQAPGSLNHAETLADLAQATLRQGQLDTATQLYRQALAAIESKTTHLGGIEEDRSRYRSIHAGYYTEYVGLLLKQGQSELAFQVLEGARARTLLETLSYDRIDIREGVDAALLDREHTLQQLLVAKSQYRIRLLNSRHTKEQLVTIDAQLDDVFEQHRVAEAEIRVKSPKYAALTQPQPLSVKEIQQLLDPETTLLEYSLGEERSFVWVVGQDSLAAYELPKRSEIESVARRAYQLLTVRNSHGPKGETETETEARWAKADADYFKTATNLSRMVLGPVDGLLQGKRLLIVSDGALQYIPFSALPTPDKPRTPLMVEHEVVNLPSASVVAELRRAALGRKEPLKAVAVLADPVFDASDERLRKRTGTRIDSSTVESSGKLGPWSKGSSSAELLTRSAADLGFSRDGRSYLNRLIYSRQEAESIMAVTPVGKGMKILDFEASRSRAMSSDLAQFQIIHFATHGLLDSKHPELSGLIFSMIDRHGKSQDGFLGLQDIYNLNLPVELVVLSACETGLGEEISGEGLIGLTRGFMYAGASRVVASLWSVSDVGTAELMGHFYKAMEQDKLRPAAALRTAQIQMWKQKRWRSPYYWAAFQLQGEWK